MQSGTEQYQCSDQWCLYVFINESLHCSLTFYTDFLDNLNYFISIVLCSCQLTHNSLNYSFMLIAYDTMSYCFMLKDSASLIACHQTLGPFNAQVCFFHALKQKCEIRSDQSGPKKVWILARLAHTLYVMGVSDGLRMGEGWLGRETTRQGTND